MNRMLSDTSQEYIGKRLRLFRRALGKRQVDLARELGWSQQKWGQWENGRRNPNIPDMIELAERYGITLDYVYRGDTSRLPDWMATRIRELARAEQDTPAPHASLECS